VTGRGKQLRGTSSREKKGRDGEVLGWGNPPLEKPAPGRTSTAIDRDKIRGPFGEAGSVRVAMPFFQRGWGGGGAPRGKRANPGPGTVKDLRDLLSKERKTVDHQGSPRGL